MVAHVNPAGRNHREAWGLSEKGVSDQAHLVTSSFVVRKDRVGSYAMAADKAVACTVYYVEGGYLLWTVPGFYGSGTSLQEAEDDILSAMTEALEVLEGEPQLDGRLQAEFDYLKGIFVNR